MGRIMVEVDFETRSFASVDFRALWTRALHSNAVQQPALTYIATHTSREARGPIERHVAMMVGNSLAAVIGLQ